MEVSPYNIWSILVLAQGVQGMLAFTSAPTHGPLPSASAQTPPVKPERKTSTVASRATVAIVQGLEWRTPQRRSEGPLTIGGISLIPRLREAQIDAESVRSGNDTPVWVVDLP
jgi:hypothetical protein